MRSALFAIPLCILLLGTGNGFGQDYMKAFPPAGSGMVRYVWNPPVLQNENDARVEIVVGKVASVDPINRHFLVGNVREEIIEGWGFPRYIVSSNGMIAGTLMAVPEGTQNVNKLVTLGGETQLFRYNSRLPVVIYSPEGLVVKIRVWRPNNETIEVKVGD